MKLNQHSISVENYDYSRNDRAEGEEPPKVTFRVTWGFNTNDDNVSFDIARLGMSTSTGITEEGAAKLGAFLTKHFGGEDTPESAKMLARRFESFAEQCAEQAVADGETASYWRGRADAWVDAQRACEAVGDK